MSLSPNCSELSTGVLRVEQREKRAVSVQYRSTTCRHKPHNVWERTDEKRLLGSWYEFELQLQ